MTTIFDPAQAPTNQINMLDNGGMEIWQRGNGPFAFTQATGGYTADRWNNGFNGGGGTYSLSISKETTIIDSGIAALKAVVSSVSGSTSWVLEQNIENPTAYRGKALTFSIRVNANTANTIRIAITDGVTQTLSSFHNGNSTYQTLTVTQAISNSSNAITFLMGAVVTGDAANTTVYFDSGTVVIGSNPASFVPLHPAIDLVRCQRYYEVSPAGTEWNMTGCQTATQVLMRAAHSFQVTKRTTPTMTGTLTTVAEVGSSTNVVANYSFLLQSSDITGFVATALKNTNATPLPDVMAYSWTASADL